MYAPRPSSPPHAYTDVALQARVLGASPHELVAILFDEALLALSVAARAVDRGDLSLAATRRERAVAILGALQASLDFEQGGSLAHALARVYRAAAQRVRDADPNDTEAILEARGWVDDIATAWTAIS